MINKRRHERRQLANMIWYDLEERRIGDDRRVAQAKTQLERVKYGARWARAAYIISLMGVLLSVIGLYTYVAK
jgi:hypothetical protein